MLCFSFSVAKIGLFFLQWSLLFSQRWSGNLTDLNKNRRYIIDKEKAESGFVIMRFLISLLIGKYTVYMSKSNQSGHAFLIHTIIISKSYLLPPFTKAITVLKLLTWSTNGETSTRYYQNIDLHKNCHSGELRYSWMIVIVQLNLRNLTQIIIFFLAERFSRFARV